MISVDEIMTHFPEQSYSNERMVEALQPFRKAVEEKSRRIPAFDESFFGALGVQSRGLFSDPFSPETWWYEKAGHYPVAEEAAHAYLKLMKDREPLAADDKVIVITNTGDVPAPNLGYAMLSHLRRKVRGFVAPLTVTFSGEGCSGYISGLREADTFLRAFPDRKVVVITAELMGTYMWHPNMESVTIKHGSPGMQRALGIQRLLFGDGCSASYITSDGSGIRFSTFMRWDNLEPDDIHLLETSNTGSQRPPFFPPHGFFYQQPGLLIRRLVDGYFPDVAATLEGLDQSPDGYAIHTGSFKILKTVQASINIQNEQISASAQVLRDHANMNSTSGASILSSMPPGQQVFSVFFGVGFSLQVAY